MPRPWDHIAQAVQPTQIAAPTKKMKLAEADAERKVAGRALKKEPNSIFAQQDYEQAKINVMWAYHNDPEARAKKRADSKARRARKKGTVKGREELRAKERLRKKRWFESLGGKEAEREYNRMAKMRAKKAKEGGEGL